MLEFLLSGMWLNHTSLESQLEEAAKKIDEAVRYVTANKIKSLAAKQMGYTTSEVGDMVAQLVAD